MSDKSPHLSRREALKLLGAASLGAFLAGCATETPIEPTPTPPAPSPTPVPPTPAPVPETGLIVVQSPGQVPTAGGHVITSLCLRDGGCIDVCPAQPNAIVPGKPEGMWPRMYIGDSCIDCGSCVPECPHSAIYLLEDVPSDYVAIAGDKLNSPRDPAYAKRANEFYTGHNSRGEPVFIANVVSLKEGEVVDLRADVFTSIEFFEKGPGYSARDQGS